MDQHRDHYGTPMPGAGAVHPINGRMRDELLNESLFLSLDHARVVIAAWADDYNQERPHSSLGYETPAAFAAESGKQWPAWALCINRTQIHGRRQRQWKGTISAGLRCRVRATSR